MSKTVRFFATASDLSALLDRIEEKIRIQFLQAGRFEKAAPRVFTSSRNIPQLGIATANSTLLCTSYLIYEPMEKILVREISSIPRFAFDQLYNPKTVILTPGGLWNERVLIGGTLATASADVGSTKIMNAFKAAFRRSFINVQGSYVGEESKRLLDRGVRLTAAEQSPIEYDVRPKSGFEEL